MQVTIKFRDLIIEDAPAKCSDKMVRSTDAPAWAGYLDRGG